MNAYLDKCILTQGDSVQMHADMLPTYSSSTASAMLVDVLLQAYDCLDEVARLALAAICRSCHVRLRSDTFAGILDDSPMPRGVVSSSTLHAMQHINNFLLRKNLGDKWTMAISEEGIKSKSFMSVIAARDTRRAGVPHVCKMQVSANNFKQSACVFCCQSTPCLTCS